MIKLLDTGIENGIGFVISGKITRDETAQIFDLAREKVEKHGRVVVLEKIESFDGFDLKAIYDEIKYLYEVGISSFTKVAVVTDTKWIEVAARLEDKIFRNIDIETFPLDAQDKAIEFLRK